VASKYLQVGAHRDEILEELGIPTRESETELEYIWWTPFKNFVWIFEFRKGLYFTKTKAEIPKLEITPRAEWHGILASPRKREILGIAEDSQFLPMPSSRQKLAQRALTRRGKSSPRDRPRRGETQPLESFKRLSPAPSLQMKLVPERAGWLNS